MIYAHEVSLGCCMKNRLQEDMSEGKEASKEAREVEI